MLRRITGRSKIVVTAVAVSMIGIAGTAVAASTYDATNADKVDGRHAVGAGSTVTNRKGKLVATDGTTGRLPNNIIATAPNADKVDGKHAVGAGSTVTNRKGKLVATDATTGRLPNNIIAKAPNADKLDGLDHSAFAKTGAFYTVYGYVGGDAFASDLYAGNWIGSLLCGTGDIAVSVDALEATGQTVRGTEVDADYGIVAWDHTATSSSIDISLRCLDTNGDGVGTLSTQSVETRGLRQYINP